MSRIVRWLAVFGLAVLGFAFVTAPLPVNAQDYPSRNVTIVVPLAPGTGVDTVARLYGEKLSERSAGPWSSRTGRAPTWCCRRNR